MNECAQSATSAQSLLRRNMVTSLNSEVIDTWKFQWLRLNSFVPDTFLFGPFVEVPQLVTIYLDYI